MKFAVLTILIYVGLHLTISDAVSDIVEDAELTTDQLIRKYKYPVEIHFATTRDNYILQLHRIPRPGGKPILLQHGLADSSAGYILMGPNISLGYYLYDKGYDVWLGNAQGNRYSRNHTTLNPDTDKVFWDFSWHEIGINGIPAMIDYILAATGFEKLYYAGHSQGTTALFVMCSMRPEYNNKIILAHALAPVAFMKHLRSPLLPVAQNGIQLPIIKSMVEFLPRGNPLVKGTCLSAKGVEDFCINFFYMVVGPDPRQFNKTKFPVVLGHLPAGLALKQVVHYLQLVKSDKFRQFDYESDNRKKYGQNSPPDYELNKVTAPIVLHYSCNDYLTEPEDVIRLSKLLPNVVLIHKMEPPLWNHMDFLYAYDTPKLINEPLWTLNERYWVEK